MEYDSSSDEELMNGDEPSEMGQWIRDYNAKGRAPAYNHFLSFLGHMNTTNPKKRVNKYNKDIIPPNFFLKLSTVNFLSI